MTKTNSFHSQKTQEDITYSTPIEKLKRLLKVKRLYKIQMQDNYNKSNLNKI